MSLDVGDLELLNRREEALIARMSQMSADDVRSIVYEMFAERDAQAQVAAAEAEAAAESARIAAADAEAAAESARAAEAEANAEDDTPDVIIQIETPPDDEPTPDEEIPGEESPPDSEEIREILGEDGDTPAPDRRGFWHKPILSR